MHELALCGSVLGILEKEAKQHSFERVTVVRLQVGRLACVVPEAMEFCFKAVTAGTLADGAYLELICTPGRAWCMICEETVEIDARYDPCPRCGGHQLQVTGGDEMRVKELEVA